MKDIHEFEQHIGITFDNPALLKEAFTHRSFLNENPNAETPHNERLEYLGDAVLELVVTDHLFRRYEDKAEGELTALRAALVNTRMISECASKLTMNDYLLLSKGEANSTETRARQYILANTFEAVVGALYLDKGIEKTTEFLQKHLIPYLDEIVEKRLWQDAKSLFQEKIQEHDGITPNYKLLKQEGPDHSKLFTMGLFVGDECASEGSGPSKQEAEQDAARKALEKMGWL